ncbi:hypothetical protein FNV43_RR13794 [Rhamnella rubrinervis]|uniref:Diacylglycerol O-acyltransferase n=1 Tax=Rhamnella rubrinervis TaxID=2594499 RepID=A0A8K0H1T5_9ROSA|nr:hypothetical protein FNV43_RR13794 [Rhamnella rubrinervis]
MEFEEGILAEPVSPIAQYCNSSAFQLSIIGVWEFSIPIDEKQVKLFVSDAFLPINPRLSSIMVGDINETQRWKKVEVKLEDHIYSPNFHSSLSVESYDRFLDEYISDISLKAFPENKPMWEIHIIKYPTTNAASSLVFRLHHALGDGYSFMSAMLSCLRRADNPALPMRFPSRQRSKSDYKKDYNIFTNLPRVFSSVFKTMSDFSWSFLKSSFVEDDRTPIRSGNDGVEFQPTTITTIFFPLDQIKLIKTKLGVTINDTICGIIFLGVRLYMHEFSQKWDSSNSTALVLLNTRKPGVDYKSLEMGKPSEKTNMAWGNRFAFLDVQVPKFNQISNPSDFVCYSQNEINRKRTPFAVYLNTKLLRIVDKFKGHEDLGITIVSYMGKLRVVLKMEKEYIDSQKLKSCVENAFETIFKATQKVPTAGKL